MSDEVIIRVQKNDSYHIKGPVKIIDSDGNPFFITPGAEVWLCRCGNSRTKPFCDGSHKRAGFESDPKADPIEGD